MVSPAQVSDKSSGSADKPEILVDALPPPSASVGEAAIPDKPEILADALPLPSASVGEPAVPDKPQMLFDALPHTSASVGEPVLFQHSEQESYPLADALFEAIGEQLDAGNAERELFNDLAEHLWKGNYIADQVMPLVSQPRAAKKRLERLLRTATEVRQKYQTVPEFLDLDFTCSLTQDETSSLHNAWMNDVESWMTHECLAEYQRLIAQARPRRAIAKASLVSQCRGLGRMPSS